MVSSLTALTSALNRYVVRPSNAFGLGGFVFDVEGDATVNLKAEITDHFLEDNSAIQDHIAIKPKKVTLKSYVGELVYEPDGNETTFVEKTVRKLTVLNGYLPVLTSAAESLKDFNAKDLSSATDIIGNVTSQTINKATDYYALAKNLLNADSRQQEAYQYFKALMEQKILISLQTPFEYVNNMAIESVTAFQGEGSKFISDFTITLKEIRVVEILNSPTGSSTYQVEQGDDDDLQGRAKEQNDGIENIGSVSGRPTDYSVEPFLPSVGLPDDFIDPLELLTGEGSRQLNSGSDPVVDLSKAGVTTNGNDE